MGFIPIALAVFQLIFRVWDTVNERNKDIKELKTLALKDGIDAIAKKDYTSITAVFDRLNRL
jgi:hypothetical protein